MSRPYLGLHDPNVTDAHYAELVDAYHDTRPTRADVDDRPEPVVGKEAVVPCGACSHLICAIQRRFSRVGGAQ